MSAVRSRLYHIRSNRLWLDTENYTWHAARQQIRQAGDTAIRHHQPLAHPEGRAEARVRRSHARGAGPLPKGPA